MQLCSARKAWRMLRPMSMKHWPRERKMKIEQGVREANRAVVAGKDGISDISVLGLEIGSNKRPLTGSRKSASIRHGDFAIFHYISIL